VSRRRSDLAERVELARERVAPERIHDYSLSELGNASRFAHYFADEFRYVRAWKSWLAWDGKRWSRDERGKAHDAAKFIPRLVADESEFSSARTGHGDEDDYLGWAKSSCARHKIENALALAESHPTLSRVPEDFDADAWQLNTASGLLDLRSDLVEPHHPGQNTTKIAPVEYDPDAEAPTWLAFLERVQPDPEVRDYLARFVGYCLTGDVSEQCVHFFIGGGANGKSVFCDVVAALLGDYVTFLPAESLASLRGGRSPGAASPDIARLAGSRLAVAKESEAGASLSESVIKDLTGGEKITARPLYGAPFDFPPQFKILLASNYRPTIRGADHGIWRRVHLVPWNVTIPDEEKDPHLAHRIKEEELPGVLRWAVDGLTDWFARGLAPPTAITGATKEFRASEDRLAEWIADECVLDPTAECEARKLYESFARFGELHRIDKMSVAQFAAQLDSRHFATRRGGKGKRLRVGIRLATHDEKVARNREPAGGG
jgi:putative DNA primase/helicase